MSERSYFVHELGICESRSVGEGTRIWAFAHVLPGAKIGKNCNICDHVFIEDDVLVGDDVTVKSGVQLWNGIRLHNRVFVGPNATFTNDRFPRSKEHPRDFLETVVDEGASIGANATILPGLHIGAFAMIGAGAVVTKNVPPHALVLGNPAIIVGYQTERRDHERFAKNLPNEAGAKIALGIGACSLWRLPHFSDLRGDLVPLEFSRDLPFQPTRSFFVYGIPTTKVRGEHAHRICEQFLIAAHGELAVVVDDGNRRLEVSLVEPSMGLHLPPLIWSTQYKFRPDTVLLVLASDAYDAADYIRDYSAFLSLVS